MREIIIVSLGSALGGGARYAVSKAMQAWLGGAFPYGTLTVNILGCLLIGFLSALPWPGGWLNPHTRLLLTTGFCGGFTTFSTFMQETSSHAAPTAILYVAASLTLGLAAVVAGQHLGKLLF